MEERKLRDRSLRQNRWTEMPALTIAIALMMTSIINGRAIAQTDSAASATADPPTIHAGDVWVDRLASGDKEFKVESINGDTVSFNQWGAQIESDKQWNTLVYRSLTEEMAPPITYSKPIQVFPFPLTPGKTWTDNAKWEEKASDIRGHSDVEGKVGNWEEVTVPAGTFHAIRVDVTIQAIGRAGARDVTNLTYWYAPKVNRFVKYHYQSQSEGNLIDAQMVSYKPGS